MPIVEMLMHMFSGGAVGGGGGVGGAGPSTGGAAPRPMSSTLAAFAAAYGFPPLTSSNGAPGGDQASSAGGGSTTAASLRGLAAHLDAVREAIAGASSGRLPASLLFSDRDFTDEDYDALLSLDAGNRARAVAPRSTIDALPRSRVPAAMVAGGDRCTICLQDYEQGESLRTLPCSHPFHAPCIERWLGDCRGSCPVCTKKVTAPPVPPRAAAAAASGGKSTRGGGGSGGGASSRRA